VAAAVEHPATRVAWLKVEQDAQSPTHKEQWVVLLVPAVLQRTKQMRIGSPAQEMVARVAQDRAPLVLLDRTQGSSFTQTK
jgi:hypothetical protein